MAAHGVCKLQTSARMSQPGCSRRPEPFHIAPVRPHPQRFLQNPCLGLSLQAWSTGTHVSKLRPIAAIVVSDPPAENPVEASTPRWSCASIKAISVSEVEVCKCRYAENRTETLLMGILLEATSVASKFLRAHGVTLLKVRKENKKMNTTRPNNYIPLNPPFSEAGQRAVDFAIAKKIKDGEGGEVTTPYLVLGIWSEVESAGHKIMANLGFTDEKAKELESLCSIQE